VSNEDLYPYVQNDSRDSSYNYVDAQDEAGNALSQGDLESWMQSDADFLERANELRGYGIDPIVRPISFTSGDEYSGVEKYYSWEDQTQSQLEAARPTAIQTEQKEELKRQRQEIKVAAEVSRRRSSGRGSLLDQLPRTSAMGGNTTLGAS